MQTSQNQKALAIQRRSLPLATFEDIQRAGTIIAKSGVLGDDSTNESGVIVAMTCQQESISIIDFVRRYDIIKGRVTKKAKVMLAEFVRSGGRYKILVYNRNEVKIRFITQDNDMTIGLTIAEADEMGLTTVMKAGVRKPKSNWVRFPSRMLFARVVSEGVGIMCPDIQAGIYTPEEVSDFDNTEVTLPEENEDEQTNVYVVDETPKTLNPEVCPIKGKFEGMKWSEIPEKALRFALAGDAVSAAHKAAIQDVLKDREEAQMAAASVEIVENA